MAELQIGLCWGTLIQVGFVELIELAARHGFPTVTVAPHLYEASLVAGETGVSLRRRAQDAGVQVRMVDSIMSGLPGLPDTPIDLGKISMRRASVTDCLEIADALGAPMVNLTHYAGAAVPFGELVEGVGAVCREAARYGVTVVLEFVPGSGIPDLAAAQALASRCGEPNCKVHFDTWHFARIGGRESDIRALPPGAIGALQLSDRIEPAPGEPYVPLTGRKLPGEGEQPLCSLVSAILANSPGITAELEVFDEVLQSLAGAEAAAIIASTTQAWRMGCERGEML